jgi:F-type H+-transporting ATPase subunit b
MLDLDISVLVVSALVGILLLVLNRLFFKPIGSVIEERETKIEKESGQIEAMTKEIEEKTLHIENVLKDTQKESRKIKEELIKKGEEVREKVVAEAREKSRQHFDTKMKQLDQQLLDAEKQLEQEIRVFSGKMKEIFIG